MQDTNQTNNLHADPLYLTALASLGESAPSKAMTEVHHNSIAVLPFLNLSGDPEQEFFTDGLTDDIITDLSNVNGFLVIARNSTFALKGKPKDVRQIGYDLGVKYVLEGSARRAENKLRINVQLCEAAQDGAHIWAERFDRDYTGVFAVQDEVTRRVVEAITGKLAIEPVIGRYKPTNLIAYDLCMRGRNDVRNSLDACTRAITLFERAIELDPHYSVAHSWLAYCQCMAWLQFNYPMNPARQRAVENAQRGVELDSTDSGAHWVQGFVLMFERRWDEAVAAFETATRLNPNDANAWHSFSDLRVMEGKGSEAVKCSERAIRLNPLSPNYFWLLGQAQFAVSDYAAVVKTLRREETYRTVSRRILAAALAQLGRIDEAHEEARLFMADYPHFTISSWLAAQPFRDLAMRDKFVGAYRLAGLAE